MSAPPASESAGGPSPSPAASLQEKSPVRRRWRRSFLVLFSLAAIALLLHAFVVETLVVTTDSMQPFLYGDPDHGDRVVVDKRAFLWSPPSRRFDPVVFRHYDGADSAGAFRFLVKRAVAFGGETLQIRDGDLFVGSGSGPLERVSKRYEEFGGLLVPLWILGPGDDWSEVLRLGEGAQGAATQDAAAQGGAGLSLEVAGRPALVELRTPLRDGYLDAEGKRVDGRHAVYDLLLRVEVVFPPGETQWTVELYDGFDLFEYHLEIGGPGSRVSILHRDAAGSESPTEAAHGGVEAGVPVLLEFWNVDQVAGVAIDGKVALSTRHRPVERPVGDVHLPHRFGVTKGSAQVRRLEVDRDLHYLPPPDGAGPVEVPPGYLYVLGDNSENSNDSRQFGPVPVSEVEGRAVAVCLPLRRARLLRP